MGVIIACASRYARMRRFWVYRRQTFPWDYFRLARHLGVASVSAIFSTSPFPITRSTFLDIFMDREVGFYAFQCTWRPSR